MGNSFGKNIKTTIFGESHMKYIGATIDGFPCGVKIDKDLINKNLQKRRPKKNIGTKRIEEDEYEIISGVYNEYTTGMPITIIIKNKNVDDTVYDDSYGIARPSHVDFVAYKKYKGHEDYRGGGHFSGRLTAALVIAGSIAETLLKNYNIKIKTKIKNIGNIFDRDFVNLEKDFEILENEEMIAVLDEQKKLDMIKYIENISKQNDSIGGKTKTVITGLKVGFGEPTFDNIESLISYAVFGIPGVKGIEFGAGEDFSTKCGSEINDEIYIENNEVKTRTNNNGGINGGISNGMPIEFDTIIRPTASIYKTQHTINFIENKNVDINLKGRHDPAIISRVPIVIDSVVSLVVADIMSMKLASDFGEK